MIATAFSGVIDYFKIKWILKNEKRKCCFSIFEINLKFKIEEKLSFSIFEYKMKLKCTKMSFSISVSQWKSNGPFGARINACMGSVFSFSI